MRFQFASIPSQFNSADSNLISYQVTGGSLSGSFYLQGWNRAGRNLLSSPITISAFSQVTFTFKSALRNSGDELFSLSLAYSQTGNIQTAHQIYRYETLDNDQVTQLPLPHSVTLTTSDLSNTPVILVGDLPSNSKNGAIRLVTSTGKYYEYSYSLGQWIESSFNGIAYIESTTVDGGCNCPLELITSHILPPPKIDDTPSSRIKFALVNDSQQIMPKGYSFNLQIRLNGGTLPNSDNAYTYLAEKIKIAFIGCVDTQTRELDDQLPSVGAEVLWHPAIGFKLPCELDTNCTAVWELWVDFLTAEINLAKIPENSVIQFLPYIVGQVGSISDSFSFTGNVVLPIGNRLRVLGGVILDGQAIIGNPETGVGYITPILDNQSIPVLQPDTTDQIIVLNGSRGGEPYVYQSGSTIGGNEAVRAFVSTESGESRLSSWSDEVICTSDSIQIAIFHPVESNLWMIRDDYPDVIAGAWQSVSPPPKFRVYIELDGTDIFYYEFVTASSSQTITISSLPTSNLISSIPNPDDNFSLYNPPYPMVNTGIAGSITGTIRVAISYYYPSPNFTITKISHDINLGCIPELGSNLTTAVQNSIFYSRVKADGFSQPQRNSLNFSNQFQVTDSPSADQTTITYVGMSGHTIVNESDIELPSRQNLKFIGFNVSDNSSNNSTVIQLSDPQLSNTVITTGTLASNAIFNTSAIFAGSSVILLNILATSNCEIWIYDSAIGQTNNSSSSLIFTRVLTANTLSIVTPNIVATSSNNSKTFWVTIKNLAVSSNSITVTIAQKPLAPSSQPVYYPKRHQLSLSTFTWTNGSMTWWQFCQLDSYYHSAFAKCDLEEGTYTFRGLFRKGGNQGIVTLSHEQLGVIGSVDNYNGSGTPILSLTFGTKTLTRGTHKFILTVTNKNNLSAGYIVEMDHLLILHSDLI